MTVEELFKTCTSRWEIDVDITPNVETSGDKYKGCMAETPWYLLDKEVKSWWFHSNVLKLLIDEE